MATDGVQQPDSERAPWWEHRSGAVSHAVGMIAAQADCELILALLLLRERAEETGRNVEDVAEEVVSRRIRFWAETTEPFGVRCTVQGDALVVYGARR